MADVECGASGPRDAFAVSEPEIAAFPFLNLELDGARPNLGFTLHTVKNAAVPGLAGTFAEGASAPFELGTQIEAAISLLCDDVSHLVARDVQNAMRDGEDVLGVCIQSTTPDKRVQPVERGTFQEVNGCSMRRDGWRRRTLGRAGVHSDYGAKQHSKAKQGR